MKLFSIIDTSFDMFEYYVVYAESEIDARNKYLLINDVPLKYVDIEEINPIEPILISSVG